MKTVSTNSSEDNKRKRIRNYFTKSKSNLIWAIGLIIIGMFILFAEITQIGIIFLLFGVIWLFFIFNRATPGDQTIDAWLIDDIEQLKKRSLERLNLDESELIRDSIVVRGPILWNTNGIPNDEIVWKKGKDKGIRFSANAITIVHLTEHKLSSYQCDYNFIRGVPLNEQDDEFYYKDVVSVSTRDEATNYTLPNGELMKHAQFFKITVPNDSIKVIVNSADLVKFTGGSITETGLDNAVKALRKVLSEKKI
ncbi:MAG: hypothetical protein QNJ63_22750 [Calothrix sp. MO_192.B10]|nr:hypothetical protein [Calothrix sp. MO_192.B10]